MTFLLEYCLKFSVSIALIFLFYQLVLRRLTFYNWNRYYLLGYSLLSFFFAFVNISPVLQHNDWSDIQFIQWIPVLNSTEIVQASENNQKAFGISDLIALLFIIGIFIMFCRLVIQLYSFRKMIKKAERISTGEMNFFQVNEFIIPFSFGNSIFVNRHLHSEEELKEIIRHEFVHVKQRHSIDILVGELLCLFNWYNPFVWLLRMSIRQNLEFIADNKVLENGINKKEYQYLLLKVIGNSQFSIAQKFNFSSLKKRIAMMNKMKTAKVNLLRFLFILPLLAVLLLAFRNGNFENRIPEVYSSDFKTNDEAIPKIVKPSYSDTTPKPAITNKKEVDLSRISDDFEITDKKAVIHLKNGKTEKYDLTNPKERKEFESKYGQIISANDATIDVISPVAVITNEGVSTTVASPNISVSGVATTIASPSVSSSAGTNITNVTSANGSTVITPGIVSNAVSVIDDQGYLITGDEDIVITITKNTTKQELEDLKKQMKEKGVDLNFEETKYDDNGILTHISGTMKSGDSKSNFSVTDFSKLRLAMYKKDGRTYFKVNTGNYRRKV